MRFSFFTSGSKSLPQNVVLLLSFTVCVALSTQAQTTQCSVKQSQLPASPELFGFQLGMTREQVKARVPEIDFGRTDDLGVSKTTINPEFFARREPTAFADVRSISFDFLDDRVSSLWFGYESSFKWHTVPDFVAGISQALRLPNAWEPWKTRGSRIRCADFQITVSTLAGGASFHLLDDNAEQTIAARRQAKDDEAMAAQAEAESEIIGDRQSKVYYSAACRPATEVKEANRIVFKTTDEAERAGYKPATKCE